MFQKLFDFDYIVHEWHEYVNHMDMWNFQSCKGHMVFMYVSKVVETFVVSYLQVLVERSGIWMDKSQASFLICIERYVNRMPPHCRPFRGLPGKSLWANWEPTGGTVYTVSYPLWPVNPSEWFWMLWGTEMSELPDRQCSQIGSVHILH